MKKSEFREFVKEMFIDLIRKDGEVREIVLEFVQENSNLIIESKSPDEPQEPADPNLYDKLVLIASGQKKKLIYEGRKVEAPNYGVGFKSGDLITEWADKAYSKIGGEWMEKSHSSGLSHENISALTSLLGGDAPQGAHLLGIAKSGNEEALKEAIRSHVPTQMLDENFQPTNIDMTDLLADTARTTLQGFPAAHPEGDGGGLAGNAVTRSREAFSGTPEQVFGQQSANNWASLAFSGADPGGE